MHADASWCIVMHTDAYWCMHGDACWRILVREMCWWCLSRTSSSNIHEDMLTLSFSNLIFKYVILISYTLIAIVYITRNHIHHYLNRIVYTHAWGYLYRFYTDSILMHADACWCILAHADACWCMLMHAYAYWCMHGDACSKTQETVEEPPHACSFSLHSSRNSQPMRL